MDLRTQGRHLWKVWGVFLALSFCSIVQAQPASQSVSSSNLELSKNRLISPVDEALTIKKVGVLPIGDNVNGIYGRPLETKVSDLVKASHRFEFTEVKPSEVPFDELVEKPEAVKNICKQSNVDAFFAGKIFKSPKKTEIQMALYLGSDGLPIAADSASLEAKVETREIEKSGTDLFAKLVEKIPYKGTVLSRKGNRVTVDVGKLDGIKANQVLSVQQVITVNRHPKFKTILSTEKEIIGKIRILKVDDSLSFGTVVQEKDRGVIEKDAKLAPTEFVTYEEEGAAVIGPMGPMEPANNNPNNTVSFGKNPREWLPENSPTFGRVTMGLGLGSFQRSGTTQYQGTKEGKAPLFPSIELKGELWLTPAWFVGFGTRQGIFSLENPNGGSPSTLSSTLTSYDFRGGYRFLLQDDFFGPQLAVHGGFQKINNFVDAQTPTAFTSTSFSGFYLGIAGSLPVTQDRRWYLDVELNRMFFPTLTETPVTSGTNSDVSITQFSFGGSHRMTNRFFLNGHIDLQFYSATFSGGATRKAPDGVTDDPGQNMSERVTQFIFGVTYLF